jgi:glycosyltransferase involved in cell wall biosynthesis
MMSVGTTHIGEGVMRIALVHDWLNGMRGGERCLEALCELYPEAHLYSLLHEPGKLSPPIENMDIRTSFIQKLPFVFSKYRNYLPLFPIAIEQFDLREYDLVVSLSHCVANGVITRPQTCHIGYTFTPMRYAWDLYHDYFGGGRTRGLSKYLIPFFMTYLRMWDISASNRVDYFVAISRYIQKRITKHYRRQADLIYPPVNTDFYTPDPQTPREDFFLIASAFAPYKRIDIAIEAFNRLNYPLHIIGAGQDAKRLQSLAGPNITFFGAPSDEEVRDSYRRCRAFIFPGEEDFGIMPVEAQACGTPVIAFAKGGAIETTIDGKTAIWFHEQTPEALMAAVQQFGQHTFSPTAIREHTRQFARKRFQEEMKAYIEGKVANFPETI